MLPSKIIDNIRVAFYIRVSTEEQAREGYGADMQLQGLESMMTYKAEHHNWSHDRKDRYIDLGCTGADLNRPDYKRMMADAKEGKFDIVAVWKIDRLSRNLSHLLGTFELLQNNKIGFYSLKENVDFSGPIGKLTFQIFGALAEFERETIKMRTKEGKVASARLGNYTLNGVPFGYDKPKSEARVNRTLIINKKEAEWVKIIYEKFLHGESLEGLARMMNENKVPKSSGNLKKLRDSKWYPNVIKETILEKAVYIGRAFQNSNEDDGSVNPILIPVPRIISDLDFEMVQHRLATISRDAKRGGGGEIFLLSRKIVDTETQGFSNRKFVGVHRTKGGHSYRRKPILGADGTMLPNREIPGGPLDEYVWGVVKQALNRPEELFNVYTEQSLDGRDYERFSKEREMFGKKLEDEEKIEIQIEEEYYRGEHSEEKRDILVTRCIERQETLKSSILELDKKIDAVVQAQATKEALESFTEKLNTKIESLSEEQKQYLINLLVDRVEVTFTKPHPVVHVILRFAPPSDPSGGTEVEPKKSPNKPKGPN